MYSHEGLPLGLGGSGPDAAAPLPLAEQLALARADLVQELPPAHILASVLAAQARPQAVAQPLPRRMLGWLASLRRRAGSSPRVPAWGSATAGPAGWNQGSLPRWGAMGLLLLGATVVLVECQESAPYRSGAWQMAQRESGFVPLVSEATIASNPAAWLVQANLSQASLASLGAPFDPARAGDAVRAELLVNARGDVLAVRFPG